MQTKEAVLVLIIRNNRVLGFRKNSLNSLSLPGGKPNPDETMAKTAIREVQEETGYTIELTSDLPFCGMDLGGYFVRTYRGAITGGDLQASCAEGAAEWCSISDIAWGHFWHYNQRMLRHFGIPIPLTGKFHSHITIAAENAPDAELAAKLVFGKPTIIDLSLDTRAQKDFVITHHFVTGFHNLNDHLDILETLNQHKRRLTEAGIKVLRVKLEHELLDPKSSRLELPISLSSLYTEVHIKCNIAEKELPDLLWMARQQSWVPSKNPLSRSENGVVQFVNRRFYSHTGSNPTLRSIDTEVDSLIYAFSVCGNTPSLQILDVRYESAVYDSNESMDSWWAIGGTV